MEKRTLTLDGRAYLLSIAEVAPVVWPRKGYTLRCSSPGFAELSLVEMMHADNVLSFDLATPDGSLSGGAVVASLTFPKDSDIEIALASHGRVVEGGGYLERAKKRKQREAWTHPRALSELEHGEATGSVAALEAIASYKES